ncbi:MAG: error-prone DNA polymerase [Hyphomicrobiaceae bacterium]
MSTLRPGPAGYAELDVTTNFTFLRGGSHAEELVATAKALGLQAIAIADRNTLAGVVRAHLAAKQVGLQLIVGARLDLTDAPSLLCLPTDREAYARLSRLLTLGQRRAEKGKCRIALEDVVAHAEGQILIALPPETWDWREVLPADPAEEGGEVIAFAGSAKTTIKEVVPNDSFEAALLRLRERLGGVGSDPAGMPPVPRSVSGVRPAGSGPRQGYGPPAALYLAASHTHSGDDRARIAALARLSEETGLPLVATGAVLYHTPERRPLQDVLTAIREKTTVAAAGFRLEANAERHLKSAAEMRRLFRGHEDAIARTLKIAQACRFSLDELVYEYPDEPVPKGKTPQGHLEDLAWEGAQWRYPDGIPEKIRTLIARELALIASLKYAPYFLTVHDIVSFARSRGILCQGRGSAANSAVCYCLAITNVNPAEIDLLFERFISPERQEPPDIDVDFEHERREEVIQYIYARYGRDRAGLAATVISYRARSAVREVGKAMGLSEDTVAALAGMVWGTRSGGVLPEEHVREAGLDPLDPLLARTMALAAELSGFPRHLSQHVGGFVLTRRPLSEVVPIGNAAMEDRTNIEWDKDDLDALGLLKVDVLGLGMLTCIRKAFELLETHHGRRLALGTIPRDDKAVYDMLCRADSLGVFQVESRAQMNMLPRLKPRTFYDLVIEVAIVRPGPIQGDMVHPYLRRRDGLEPEDYPSPSPQFGPPDELRQILGKTKGVPLFQEQAMKIAMVAAEFSPEEANELRRAMATFRRRGTIGLLEEKMVSRMVKRGYGPEFAARCFNQIKGFGEYGFPESHAASFAHLVYVSSWLKCHYPEAFAAALLNSQPMGFYAPAQIVRDAREHGVEARPVDVGQSDWDATLEPGRRPGTFAMRLGLRQVDGLQEEEGRKLVGLRPVGWVSAGANGPVEHHADPARNPTWARVEECWVSAERVTQQPEHLPLSGYARAAPTQPARREIQPPPLTPPHEGEGDKPPSCLHDPHSDLAVPRRVSPILPSPRTSSGVSIVLAPASPLPRGEGQGGGDACGFPSKADVAIPAGETTHWAENGQAPQGVNTPSPLEGEGRGGGYVAGFEPASSPLPQAPKDLVASRLSPRRLALPLEGGGKKTKIEAAAASCLNAAARAESREHPPPTTLEALHRGSGVTVATLEKLAAADAFRSFGLDRRQALWQVRALVKAPELPLFAHAAQRELGTEPEVALPLMPLGEHVVADYQTLRLSLKAHPMTFLREAFREEGIIDAGELRHLKDGARVAIAGVVLVRQRPGTAKGVVFMTLEDETGVANSVVWPNMLERFRKVVMTARLILIKGVVQRHENIIHIVAQYLEDRSPWLRRLAEEGPTMKVPIANADEVKRPEPGSARGPDAPPKRPALARHPRDVRILPPSRDFH